MLGSGGLTKRVAISQSLTGATSAGSAVVTYEWSKSGTCALAAILATSCLILSSCFQPAHNQARQDVHQSTELTQSGPVPTFEGPYAHELQDAYRTAESDYFRKVILDGKITATEYYETQDRAKKCLEDNGFTHVIYSKNGGSSTGLRDDIDAQAEFALHSKCEKESGLTETELWYFSLNANPDNVDWPSAERDCLVKAGLLEDGSTVEEMDQWYASGAIGSQSHGAYVCSEDTLGHLGLH